MRGMEGREKGGDKGRLQEEGRVERRLRTGRKKREGSCTVWEHVTSKDITFPMSVFTWIWQELELQ
jgi:hypothetical protein